MTNYAPSNLQYVPKYRTVDIGRGETRQEEIKDLDYWYNYFVTLGRKIFTREQFQAWGKLFPNTPPRQQDFGTTGHQASPLLKAAVTWIFARAGGAGALTLAQAAAGKDTPLQGGSALDETRMLNERDTMMQQNGFVDEQMAAMMKTNSADEEQQAIFWFSVGIAALIIFSFLFLKKG